jgi:hypothetical protein
LLGHVVGLASRDDLDGEPLRSALRVRRAGAGAEAEVA